MGRRNDCEWSGRERQVLDLIARGRTNGEIAEQLGISFSTAKWHVSELITKLGVDSREEVAEYWRRECAPRQRLARAIAGFSLPAAAKIGFGAVAAVSMAAGAIAVGADAGFGTEAPQDDTEWTLQAASGLPVAPTPSPTPSPTPEPDLNARPPGCPQPPFRVADGPPLCRYTEYPELVALDKGGCDFSGADIAAVMPQAGGRYQWLDLSGCNLTGANLRSVMGNNWSLAGANLEGADLFGATFAEADFSGANLRGADVSAVLYRANMTDADLTDATAVAIQANLATWSGTICPDGAQSDAAGGSCVGHGVLLMDPRSASSRPNGDVCPPPPGVIQWAARCDRSLYPALAALAGGTDVCDLAGADLSYQHLESADLRGCDLRGANLAHAALDGAVLTGANLDGAVLSSATMAFGDLSGVSAAGATFAGALFHSTVRDDADFTQATCPDGTLAEPAAAGAWPCAADPRPGMP